MLKKLFIWLLLIVTMMKIWETAEFQQYKDRIIGDMWSLADEKSGHKKLKMAEKFGKKMSYWMENFSAKEKAYIAEVALKTSNFNAFLENYCYEKVPFHPILNSENLIVACDKARALKQNEIAESVYE